MATRDVTVAFHASTADLEAALARAGIVADTSGKKIGDRFTAGTSEAAHGIDKLKSSASGLALPFTSALDAISSKFDAATARGNRFGTVLADSGRLALVAGGAGFTAAAGEALKMAENFGQATTSIQNSARISQKSAQDIGNAFLATGGKTTFSATEMAQAYGEVAGRLGEAQGQALSTAQATRFMAAASDLAEASQTSLGTATSALARVLGPYHMTVAQAAQAANVLYNTSRVTQVPIDQLSSSMDKLHGRLGVLAPSISDVGALMVKLSDFGITGGRAMMQVNTAFQTLVGTSKAVHTVLSTLGVSVFNSQGQFVGLQSVIQQLQPKIAGLTQQQQLYVTQTLFGKQAGQAMLQIIEGGVSGWQKATQAVQAHNAMSKAAETQAKTLHGEIETMSAAVQDLGTKFGLFLIPKLTQVVGAVEQVVQWFEKHKAAAIALAAAITGILGAAVTMFVGQKVATFVGGIKEMASAVATGATSMAAKFGLVGTSSTTMATEVEGAETAVADSTEAMATTTDAALTSTGVGAALVAVGIAAAELETHWSSVMSAMQSAVNAMVEAAEAALNQLISQLNGAISLFNSTIGQLTGQIGQINKVGTGGVFGPSGNVFDTAHGLAPYQAPGINTAGGKGFVNQGGVPIPSSGSNAQKIAGALAAQGFSKVAIAGILGNFAQENGGQTLSGISTSSGPGGIGIAQWIGGRATAEQSYAAIHQESPNSINAQIGFLVQELRTDFHGAFTAVQSAKTPQAAALAFEQAFEKAGAPNNPARESLAAQAYGWLTGGGAGGGSGAASGNAAIQALINKATGKTSTKKATFGPSQNVENMLTLAQELVGAPYSKAGHAAAYQETVAQIKKFGTDCSGLVSVLLKEGISGIKAAQTTQGLPTNAGLAPGVGKYVTVYDRHTGPTADEHTLIEILGHYFESGGNSKYNPTGGVSELTRAQAAGELAGGGFEAFHPTAAYLNTAVKGAKNSTFNGIADAANLQTAINNFISSLVKASTALIQTFQNLQQSGTAKTLEKALGVGTGGKTSGKIHTIVEGLNIQNIESQLAAGKSPTALDTKMDKLLEKVAAPSAAMQKVTGLISGLMAAGQTSQAKALAAQVGATFATLAQELYAQQVLKDAESLQLQATQEKDQTTLTANSAADQLQVIKDSNQRLVDEMSAAATQIKDATTAISDSFSAMAQSITDSTTVMADASNTVVSSISDNTQVQVDILGERGLYGLNLIAQKEQVQLDQAKAYYDQQIDVAQQNLDVVKAQWDTAIAAAQANVDQVQIQEDSLISQQQEATDTAQIDADTKVAAAQAHVDAVTLGQDIAVQLAQTAVDLSASAPKAQQDIANAALRKAEGNAAVAEAKANAVLTTAQIAANAEVAGAQQALAQAQGNAAIAEANAQQALATAQGQAAVATANAQQVLTGIQDQAQQTEAQLQGNVSITQAEAQTQYAGSGLVVNMYGLNPSDAAANASELGWVLRTQVPA